MSIESWGGISSDEMRVVDENAEWLGVPRSSLMENAGASVARAVYEWLGGLAGRKVVVFCGTGNNGGDGMVAARHMASMGAEVTVILIGSPEKIRTEHARRNLNTVKRMRETIKLVNVRDVGELERLRGEVEEAEAIVDAIFGTGIRGSVREPWRTAITMINSARGVRVAVDIPSGVDPDTGDVHDIAVEANVTVTFHRPKIGIPAARDYCGEVIVAPIGIPPEAEMLMGPGDARRALKNLSKPLRKIVLLEDVGTLSEILEIFGAEYSSDIGEIGGGVVYIGKASRDSVDAAATVSRGLSKNASLSLLDSSDAEELGIRFEEKVYDTCKWMKKAAEEAGETLYVFGELDLVSDGRGCKVSWVNRPLSEKGKQALIASTLVFLAGEVEAFHAAAASGYLAGVFEESGVRGLEEELKRLGAV